MDYYMERSINTEGFTPDVLWTPFVADDGRVGYRVQKEGSEEVTFIYMAPSTGTDSADAVAPDVFIYQGEHNDPAQDVPLHFYTPFEPEDREPSDDEIYNRHGMEGGIGYDTSGDIRDEHDASL